MGFGNDAGKDVTPPDSSAERSHYPAEYFMESAKKSPDDSSKELVLTAQQLANCHRLYPGIYYWECYRRGSENGMSERAPTEFLKNLNGNLFKKSKHGNYTKL